MARRSDHTRDELYEMALSADSLLNQDLAPVGFPWGSEEMSP